MRIVLALLILLGAGAPTSAWAHASLLGSEPADGARLERPPGEVVLRFDEPVGLVSVRLAGPGGAEIAPLSPPAAHGSVVHAAYPRDLAPGGYVLSYRVTSADSHPVAGAIAFGIGTAAPSDSAAAAASGASPTEAVRFLFYGATLLAAGLCLFRAGVAEPGAGVRRTASALGAAGIGLAALQVGLRGALLAGEPVSALLRASVWGLGAGTTLGASLAVTGCGLLACAVALRRTGRAAVAAGAAGALASAFGFALTGHTATAEPRWLTAPAVGLHTLAVAFWLGGLAALFGLLRQPAADAGRAVGRFSALAVPAVAVLVACGLTLAAIQVQTPAALVRTTYGLLVCGKLALLAGLIGLAAWNRNRLTPALLAGEAFAAPALRASIAGEAVLAALVLALTSVLTLTPPPRAAHGSSPALLMAMAGDVMAHFGVSPARPGRNRIGVTLVPEHVAPKEVWLELSQPRAGIGPLRRRLEPDGAGGWEIENSDLAVPGRWTLRLELLVSDYDQLTLTAELDLQ